MAARSVGSSGTVHAFEPSCDLAERLEADARRNGFENLIIHRFAVSDREGTTYLAESSNCNAPAGGRFMTNSSEGKVESVGVVSIDSYIPAARFDVVKIDIEGAELRAIEGMTGAIRRLSPRLMLIEAIDEHLHRFGDSVAQLNSTMTALGYSAQPILEAYFADMIAFRKL